MDDQRYCIIYEDFSGIHVGSIHETTGYRVAELTKEDADRIVGDLRNKGKEAFCVPIPWLWNTVTRYNKENGK